MQVFKKQKPGTTAKKLKGKNNPEMRA